MSWLGDLQLDVMEVIWQLGSGTVAEVHEELARERTIAYTTVLSTLRSLERRGFLRHTREGKAHRYHARVPREEYAERSVQRLVDHLFAGRPEQLMSHLLGGESLDASTRERIRRLLGDDPAAGSAGEPGSDSGAGREER